MTKHVKDTDIKDVAMRSVASLIDPEGKFLAKLTAKAKGEYHKDIIVKFGVDPTRPDIHLGHAVNLQKLRKLQDMGCKVVFLVGDFTTRIGDPTGKSKTRPELDQKEIEKNVTTYLEQVGKILSLDPVHFAWIRNSDWFVGVTDISAEGASDSALVWNVRAGDGKDTAITLPPNSFVGKALLYEKTRMQNVLFPTHPVRGVSLVNLLAILRGITYAQLIERDMFQQRMEKGEPLFMHEMLYPVIQGVDSDVLAGIFGSCDLEMGGTDQTFNMLMGRKVMEMTGKDPQAVMSLDLLVGLDGKEKMSKSLDNYIAITDEPRDMYGKVMSIPDSAIGTFSRLATFTPLDELERLEAAMKKGDLNPRDAKMNLARQIVAIYHGERSATDAEEEFIRVFQKKDLPDDIKDHSVTKDTKLSDALLAAGIVKSKSDFRRLVDDGAVSELEEGSSLTGDMTIIKTTTFKIGKRRFIRIVVREKP